MTPVSSLVARLRRRLADSAWASIAGKLALYAVGLFALALVGSGKLFAKNATPEVASARAPTSAAPSSSSASAVAHPVAVPVRDGGADAPSPPQGPAVTEDGKVAINRATENDLRRLPGIGATKAKAILALRSKLGRFKKPEDLLRIKGIGRRSLARIKPLVVID